MVMFNIKVNYGLDSISRSNKSYKKLFDKYWQNMVCHSICLSTYDRLVIMTHLKYDTYESYSIYMSHDNVNKVTVVGSQVYGDEQGNFKE